MNYSKEKLEKLKHRWTTPNGKKTLKLIKESRCYLSPALFHSKIHRFPGIKDPELNEGVDLRGAPLSGFDFRVAIKEEDDGFTEEIAIINNIHFEGANLKYTNFENGKIHNCFFENSNLEHADFTGSTINNCQFIQAICNSMSLDGVKLINCNFTDAEIKDMAFDSTITDPKTTFGKQLKSDKEKHYHFASIEYRQIKNMYRQSSLHEIADKYHYKEMVAKRQLIPKTSPLRWVNYCFGDLLCKYGTSFIRVLIWSLIIIFIAAFIFTKNASLGFYNTPIEPNFLDSLYFSIVTFTTLGYGDFHAIGNMRFIAAAQSFIGAALMSLFTVIVAREIIRD